MEQNKERFIEPRKQRELADLFRAAQKIGLMEYSPEEYEGIKQPFYTRTPQASAVAMIVFGILRNLPETEAVVANDELAAKKIGLPVEVLRQFAYTVHVHRYEAEELLELLDKGELKLAPSLKAGEDFGLGAALAVS